MKFSYHFFAFPVDLEPKQAYKEMLGSMSALWKNLGLAVLVTMICVYAFLQMTGPNGLRALLEKREQIRRLEMENEILRRQNELRKQRIQRLKESREEQELEIRRRFKLQEKGTVDFYLPPGEARSEDATPSAE